VMRRADVADQYEKLGLFPQPSSPLVLADQIKDQLNVWGKTMRSLGMPLE
jgi:tripartite-type tricarboxylate transporter receptor subunit TctC